MSELPSCCAPSRGVTPPRLAAAPAPHPGGGQLPDLVELDGARFWMGCDRGEGHPADGEGPARETTVEPFAIAPCAVTNREFAAFVEATDHVTDAERYGWSFVFAGFIGEEARGGVRGQAAGAPWWLGVDGATWSAPFGPGSSLEGLEEHPVVHVSWNDAVAFCAWAGGRLPSEPEWEYAARGGLERKRYPWGDELLPDGAWRCNVWQGAFPDANSREDGYAGTAPVRTYEPNGFGLYQTAGNVWEWCSDPFGPMGVEGARSIRGGSYMCHDSYCNRYRVAARSANTPDSSGGNMGFRCAR